MTLYLVSNLQASWAILNAKACDEVSLLLLDVLSETLEPAPLLLEVAVVEKFHSSVMLSAKTVFCFAWERQV